MDYTAYFRSRSPKRFSGGGKSKPPKGRRFTVTLLNCDTSEEKVIRVNRRCGKKFAQAYALTKVPGTGWTIISCWRRR